MEMIPGSSMVEHSAVNRRVASSNLPRGANFSFILNYLQTAIFSSLSFEANCHENVTLLAFRTAACWLSLHAGLARPFPTDSDVWFPGCCDPLGVGAAAPHIATESRAGNVGVHGGPVLERCTPGGLLEIAPKLLYLRVGRKIGSRLRG